MKFALTLAALALATSAASCGSSSSTSGSTDLGPKVAGKVKLGDMIILSDQKAAIKKLASSHAYCQWDGDHVHVHITFHNGTAAHITVKVNPSYTLGNAGVHGTGITNEQSVGIDASATRVWDGDAGSPAGVSGHPAIVKCSPRVQDVSLG